MADRLAEIRARVAAADSAEKEVTERCAGVPKGYTINQLHAHQQQMEAELRAHAPGDVRFLLLYVQGLDDACADLRAERDRLQAQVKGHCDRIAAQSELLAKRAEVAAQYESNL
jgi:hypothetical protein